MHKRNKILIKAILAYYVPLYDIHIMTILHCSTVHISATPLTVFDAVNLKLATQFRQVYCICMKETES